MEKLDVDGKDFSFAFVWLNGGQERSQAPISQGNAVRLCNLNLQISNQKSK